MALFGIVQAFHLIKKGLQWVKAQLAPKVSREDRQYLATSAKNGVGLCNKKFPEADVEGWVRDYENWREGIERLLQERFPESDEMEFRNPGAKWPLPSPEGLERYDDAHLQGKRRFVRDLNIVGDIIRRHTERGLAPLWVSPWKS